MTSFIVDAAAESGFAGYPLIEPKTGESPRDRETIGPLIAADTAPAVASSMFPLFQGIPDGPHLREVEELLRPVGREQHASRSLCGVPDADLVIDVAVRDRHVGEHEVGEIDPLDHLRDDQRARVLIRTDGIVAERLDGRREGLSQSALKSISPTRSATPPADLISARLFRTLRSVAMRFYSHLSDDERDQIAILRAAGRSMGAIARALGRAKTTISRELQRNALPSGGYSPLHAAGAYQLRRRREAILEREAALRLFVRDRLAEGWTPEQISGWLKSGNEPRLRAIGCETIYAFIYRTGQKAEALWRYLTRRHKRRRPRRARASRDTIKDRASIHDRPKTIESRGEAGHWEGDLIICKCTRPVLVLHERKSRVTLAARLTGKTAAETISAMLAVFGRIDPHLRRSITFDNDTAFAQHGLLRTMRDMTTWFCDAYASWQKGGIENANGRLRRWLPRHLDIDRTSDREIQEIVLTTNLTPRKCLGFKTPFQALLAELGKDVQIRFS